MILKEKCPVKNCGKIQQEVSRKSSGKYYIVKLECGHTLSIKATEIKKDKITTIDGKNELYPFQYEGVQKCESAGLRFLFADEMGLGKTPQILGTLKRHPGAFPVIILVKASIKHQWAKECVRWLGKEHLPFIVHSSKDQIIDIFDTYIIGLDLLKNLDLEEVIEKIKPKTIVIDECQLIKNRESQRTQSVQRLVSGRIFRKRVDNPNLEKRKIIKTITEDLMKYHGIFNRFKLNFEDLDENKLGLCECECKSQGIITGKLTLDRKHAENDTIDEVMETILHEIAHAITPGPGHKKIWEDTAKSIGCVNEHYPSWCNGTIEPQKEFSSAKYLLMASGTPIKNRTAEYFTALNMLRPNKFPSFDDFQRYYISDTTGGLRPAMVETFKEMTKEFIIRRERLEVMPELPIINRTFNHIEMGDVVNKAYQNTLKKFKEAYNEMEEEGGWGNNTLRTNVLAYITKMRHLVGVAKVEPLIEYVEEFLFDTNRKLCIFLHHKDVAQMVHDKVNSICADGNFNAPLMFTSDLDSHERESRKQKFINDPLNRIAILSTLSSGEGLDGLQKVCSDMIMLERQWNPANEEQVEGRFSRIGFNEEIRQVNAVYFLATGTIDEFFANLVEKKRGIVKNTLNGTELSWHEDSLMRELVEILASKGGKKWSL